LAGRHGIQLILSAAAWLWVLSASWRAAGVPAERAELLLAICARIVVTEGRIVSVRLTLSAYARGLALACPKRSYWRARQVLATKCAGMGDEHRDDAAPERVRADAYSSARIGAAAALTLVVVILLVLGVAVPDDDVGPGILLPLLGAILACLHQTANAKATAMQGRIYANRPDSHGPSATAYIAREGTS
jgi:hypothetical protein